MNSGRRQFLRIIDEEYLDAHDNVVIEAPAPRPAGILLARANPDGSRKACRNCIMFVVEESCIIHDRSINVTPKHTCGYHVYGKPMDAWMDHPGIQPVDPAISGLEYVPQGTACDNCFFYEGTRQYGYRGLCHQARDPKDVSKHATVEARECCAAWWPSDKSLS